MGNWHLVLTLFYTFLILGLQTISTYCAVRRDNEE